MVGRQLKTITSMEPSDSFWKGKSVFLTGHTGFKGTWLAMWLYKLGAQVTGFSLDPPTEPSLFCLVKASSMIRTIKGDIRDSASLQKAIALSCPEIVIHLAAQSLVRESYISPVDTYSTNVMGTVNLLEALRQCPTVRAVLNVTSDKCYENSDIVHSFIEDDPLGGYDPYSSSKACSEILTAAWRSSFFKPLNDKGQRVCIATARAGNVIGGGDWASDRLIPDIIKSVLADKPVYIRNPHAIRPWQHVLEPLSGYLLLAQKLYEQGSEFAGGWNFGPPHKDARSVGWIVNCLFEKLGNGLHYEIDNASHPHEAHFLRLDCSKAMERLGWYPRWGLDKALSSILEWLVVYRSGSDIKKCCMSQIEEYEKSEPF